MASIAFKIITRDEPSREHISNGTVETNREYDPSYPAVLKFMNDQYKTQEFLEKYLRIGKDVPVWNADLIKTLHEGMSVFAYDTNNQLCVGVCLCGIVSRQNHTTKSLEQLIGKGYLRAQTLSLHIENLLMASSEKFQVMVSSAGTMFYVAYVIVKEQYGGRITGRQMALYCLEEFVEKWGKHPYAYTVCSSKFSQQIFKKLGFKKMCELRFVDVQLGEEHVIQKQLATEPHTNSKGYVLKMRYETG